jgi:hypothetical protein
MRTCHICGTQTEKWCPTCVAAFKSRQSARKMTGDERAAEMRLFAGPLEIPFALLHQRIEELVGRPVWTHELGTNFDGLVEEARTRQHPTFEQIVAPLAEKAIIVEVE